jgi:Fe-S oxidoreductase
MQAEPTVKKATTEELPHRPSIRYFQNSGDGMSIRSTVTTGQGHHTPFFEHFNQRRPMISRTYLDAFVPTGKTAEGCIECGICLQQCPVMQMEQDESLAEMARLINGEPTRRVLDECTFCFSCNHYCPQGLRPYNLIMERMTAKNRESGKGIPPTVEYMMTGKTASGFFYDQYAAGSAEDKAILDRWTQVPAAAKEILFIGCFGRTLPQSIEYSKTLSTLPKFAPRDACCGEIPHRFGDYPYFSETVDRTRRHLESLETERLVCYCGSCANYLGHIWPQDHGVTLPYPIVSLYEWLWEKYQAGDLTIPQPVEKRIVLTDSCYSSELGDGFYQAIRGLLAAAGLSVMELENNRYDSLCCGFACTLSNGYDPARITAQGKRKVAQILATGLKTVSCYCPGCWSNIHQAGAEHGIKARFAINDLLRAFGDAPPDH